MSIVHTSKLSGRLEKLIDFRVGEGASERHPIVLQGNNSCPATDGTQVFLPRRENHFVSEKDNELFLAYVTSHEADHIREYEEYFGADVEQLREQEVNLIQEFHDRNFSELTENPALAGEIRNIINDRRIDDERKKQLPGVKKYCEETLEPTAEYLRPSVKGMSKLDAFREQYLQRALIGRVVDPVPEENRELLEEVVALTNTADSIFKTPEVTKQIYQRFKENFDITQPISRLPGLFGTGNHWNPLSRGSQQGYGKEVKPRDGREEGKRPKKLDKGEGKLYKPSENKDDKAENKKDKNKEDEKIGKDEKDSSNFYEQAKGKYGIKVYVAEPKVTDELVRRERSFKEKYAGEIESMKRIFRQLQLKHYGEKRDFQGQELDYEDYMQSELEFKVTGIRGNGRHFKRETQNEQRPAFGIHADISGSTSGDVIEGIRAAFYIMGNALSASDWNYSIYASADNLLVLKDPTKRWNGDINYNIMDLKSGGNGIYLASTSSVISRDLKRVEGNPKGLIVISDFEVCGNETKEKETAGKLYDTKVYPFLIAIGKEHEGNVRKMTEDIGEEHYSVIPLNKLHELPNEMFRLFKTFGISR